MFAERRGHVYAWGVYVEPTRLREGIGSRLMACPCANTNRESVIELSVPETRGDAVRFFEALGSEESHGIP